MKAAYFTNYSAPITIQKVPIPTLPPDGAIIKVKATGICRSDWHGWKGHDSDVQLPHVPGHEFSGIIEELGKEVRNWKEGQRVTIPFSGGCGYCGQCVKGHQQVCDNYFQAGFTAWGSFAEYVVVRYADVNLVALPESMEFKTAAILACRFITSFRAVVAQGKVAGGQWVAVYGCGGVGLSAIMIANALGAQVIAIDLDYNKLAFAKSIGAHHTLNAKRIQQIPEAVKALSKGGAHVSLDALGSHITCQNSIRSLRKRGKHIQIGLLSGDQSNPPLPMGPVVAHELEIIGSHGMQAHQYPAMMDMISNGILQPEKLIGKEVNLEEGILELQNMDSFPSDGITVITQF